MGLYIEVQYRGDWWGEDPLAETAHETTGDLFRSLAGMDKRRHWEYLGRCTGKVYVDAPDADGDVPLVSKAQQVGWVFVARNPAPVNRGDTQPTGLREAWVTVHDAPPTVTTKMHYHSF